MRHQVKSNRAKAASAKSLAPCTALIHTGSYSAASRMPTTEALIPAIARRIDVKARSLPHSGRAAPTSKKEGRKIATVASAAPTGPEGLPFPTAPRNAEGKERARDRSEEHTSELQSH